MRGRSDAAWQSNIRAKKSSWIHRKVCSWLCPQVWLLIQVTHLISESDQPNPTWTANHARLYYWQRKEKKKKKKKKESGHGQLLFIHAPRWCESQLRGRSSTASPPSSSSSSAQPLLPAATCSSGDAAPCCVEEERERVRCPMTAQDAERGCWGEWRRQDAV